MCSVLFKSKLVCEKRAWLPFLHNYRCSIPIIFISMLSCLCSANTGCIYKCLLGRYREYFFLFELHIYAIHAESVLQVGTYAWGNVEFLLFVDWVTFNWFESHLLHLLALHWEVSSLDGLSLFKKDPSLLFLISAQRCLLFVSWITSPEFAIFNKHIIDKMLSSSL